MKKLLLLPITIPLGMARGAVEGAFRTAADALLDLAGDRDGDGRVDDVFVAPAPAPVTPHPGADGQDEDAVVDLDIGSAAPRRRPASRPPRSATTTPPAPVETAGPVAETAAPAAESPREVAEALGLQEGHTPEEAPEVVETEGAASAGPEITVDEPWPGYGKMRAPDVVDRLRAADAATRALVRLYEQQHRKRRTVLAAAG